MAIFHIEIHTRDRQIEHYIAPNCASDTEALQKVRQFFIDKGQRVGLWDKESDRNDLQIPYLIFNITQLENEPVSYIAGEYRPQYPI